MLRQPQVIQASSTSENAPNRRPEHAHVVVDLGLAGDIEPLAALAPRVRDLGAEVRVCAPPDEEFGALFARVGVTPIPLGPSTRSVAAGLKAPSPDAAFRRATELVAARFETLPGAADGVTRWSRPA